MDALWLLLGWTLVKVPPVKATFSLTSVHSTHNAWSDLDKR